MPYSYLRASPKNRQLETAERLGSIPRREASGLPGRFHEGDWRVIRRRLLHNKSPATGHVGERGTHWQWARARAAAGDRRNQ